MTRIHPGMVLSIFLACAPLAAAAERNGETPAVIYSKESRGGSDIYLLANDRVRCLVTIREGKLAGDRIELLPSPAGRVPLVELETDADFGLDVWWTGWQAPGKANNAENPVLFSKQDFHFNNAVPRDGPGGTKRIEIEFTGDSTPLEVRLVYELEPEAFYARRNLGVRWASEKNTPDGNGPGPHFLRWTWPRRGTLSPSAPFSPLKRGGFGQPVAFGLGTGGGFLGLEYPTSENSLAERAGGTVEIACGQEMGERIASTWVESEWVVEALTPDPFVKLWFWKYLDRIRPVPLKPCVLYNSWYDFRNPDYQKGPDRVLDERNLLRAADILGRKLVRERGVGLDAFLLDDGWDTYAGDWILSPSQFPRGLAPISAALGPMGAKLGLWIGPTGGYFNRAGRVRWMREHGYETVGTEMCVAGERYKALLKKRVTEFIRRDGVASFKWDGLQFSCSEPGHGHLPEIYSRRAAMEAVAELSRAARAEAPDMFLNITSGTWLSPWWLKYADTIWMQGQDYGFADVPSISRRDQSTTYRDSVLFDDLKTHDFWFPVSSLMTHGVIKARISPFADAREPLDKFTDEVVLYAARGIAMWELYISPDLLTDAEWDAEAAAIRWLKEKYDLLDTVEMIGGDPRKHEPYGYVHFQGGRGIAALRNPVMEPKKILLEFAVAAGLRPDARDLVLERIYPAGWISPRLFRTGESIEILLQGFETAVYEVYPVSEAREPLLAGAVYESRIDRNGRRIFDVYEAMDGIRLLNPGKVLNPPDLGIQPWTRPSAVAPISFSPRDGSGSAYRLSYRVGPAARAATLAVLLTPDPEFRGKPSARLSLSRNGRPVEAALEEEKGSWRWHKIPAGAGAQDIRIDLAPDPSEKSWTGRITAWVIAEEYHAPCASLAFTLKDGGVEKAARLPRPFPAGVIPRTYRLGDAAVRVER